MKGIILLVVVVAVLAGILFFLSGRGGEQPVTTIEQPVAAPVDAR